jgi:hypothetical protein
MKGSQLAITSTEKRPDAQPYLHRIDPGIWRSQTCVRDVHIAQFQTDVVSRAENVHAERGLVGEVNGIGAGGDAVIGEERTTAEFEVGRKSAVTFEVPLEAEWVESRAVCGVGRLEDEEDGDCVDGIFKSSAEKAGQVQAGKDPSIPQAGVQHSGVASPTANRVAAARPNLDFAAALLGTGLGAAQGRCDQQEHNDEEARAHDGSLRWR